MQSQTYLSAAAPAGQALQHVQPQQRPLDPRGLFVGRIPQSWLDCGTYMNYFEDGTPMNGLRGWLFSRPTFGVWSCSVISKPDGNNYAFVNFFDVNSLQQTEALLQSMGAGLQISRKTLDKNARPIPAVMIAKWQRAIQEIQRIKNENQSARVALEVLFTEQRMADSRHPCTILLERRRAPPKGFMRPALQHIQNCGPQIVYRLLCRCRAPCNTHAQKMVAVEWAANKFECSTAFYDMDPFGLSDDGKPLLQQRFSQPVSSPPWSSPPRSRPLPPPRQFSSSQLSEWSLSGSIIWSPSGPVASPSSPKRPKSSERIKAAFPQVATEMQRRRTDPSVGSKFQSVVKGKKPVPRIPLSPAMPATEPRVMQAFVGVSASVMPIPAPASTNGSAVMNTALAPLRPSIRTAFESLRLDPTPPRTPSAGMPGGSMIARIVPLPLLPVLGVLFCCLALLLMMVLQAKASRLLAPRDSNLLLARLVLRLRRRQ